MMSKPHKHTTKIHVKAFIVTLLGRLSSSNGLWRICASISDGTGYLDVELSDEVLTGLLGFSVAEKGALKRDPARRGELDTGMMRCQQELVDMCCVMTIEVEAEGRKAVVTKAQPVDEKVLQELEQRVACLRSLRANQVERLNQDPAMHVDSLLCANEAGYDGGVREEGERSNP
ncbi:RecQ-mediated genome instability protein 1 [Larimichthys crocea]|uniref:RecQ-mediated genome instability protein 1 n=1 Tax=Larimichthys crocea TaxID=215358 RepID=A0A6G0ILC1_LARCR|nr:RecQ-mediated genome instability protein 1 [Larimichthys crocea]